MFLLLFYVRDNKYALDTSRIIEIVPRIKLRKIPHAFEFVAGIFNYHNIIVPVIDLCTLFHGEPCFPCFGTRIILVKYPGEKNNTFTLGLIAERVIETRTVTEADLISPGINIKEAPYLGKIITDKQETIQIIQLDRLLTESMGKSLFTGQMMDK
ncbi:hypothetical protein AMJ80_01760 [bacterium SM23_31]|nr:MAG: hypothetical protein AMJ80_01760 [bacterium SM23_31]